MKKWNRFSDKGKDFALLFIRLIISWRLIAGTWPYISTKKQISEVVLYFNTLQVPVPTASAYLSIYLQFICAILYSLGLWFRVASGLMIINFIIAIVAAHLNDTIDNSFAAWIILAASIFFMCNGAGNISVDYRLRTGADVNHHK